MSRLYVRTKTDRRKRDATACANEETTTCHNWGSANDSMQAVGVTTTWHPFKSRPCVEVTLGYGIDYIVTDVTGKVLTQLN